jgi:hypothetical protein
MSQALPTEIIVTLALVAIPCIGLALSWLVVRRWEAWSEHRARRRSPEPSVEFRAVADWMVRPEQFSSTRR